MMDLVEAMTKKDDDQQIKLLQNIYRVSLLFETADIRKEQITALIEENASLKKKNETLREELDCSVCMHNEANCLLRPCGYVLTFSKLTK